MTSSSSENEFNDVNEDLPPIYDDTDDDDNNNATNAVNSLEKAEDSKGEEEAGDDCADGSFIDDDASEELSEQLQDFIDDNFDDEANDVLNVQIFSEDNIAHEAYTSCINNVTCHPDDSVNKNATVVMLSPNKSLSDKKPTLASAKKNLKDVNELNQHMKLNANNFTELMAKEFFTFLWNITVSQCNAIQCNAMQ